VRVERSYEEEMIYCDTTNIEDPRAGTERARSSHLNIPEMGRRRQALAGLRGDTRSPKCVERMARSSFESGRVDTESSQGHLLRD
jgi:hypothetical protein